MTDYSKLSDFEINKRVDDILHPPSTNFHHVKGYNKHYCSNPADAWYVITENKINIAFDCNENEWVAWGNFEFDHCGWDMINEPSIHYSHSNPLRAAMIVFLQMQENKQ